MPVRNITMADPTQRVARPIIEAVAHVIQATNAVDLFSAHLKMRNVAATAASASGVSIV